MSRTRTGWFLGVTLTLILAAGYGPSERSGDAVTTGSLYEEMIDMVWLTKYPEPAYRTIQYSSYDRRSVLPGGPGWFANSDGFGGIRPSRISRHRFP